MRHVIEIKGEPFYSFILDCKKIGMTKTSVVDNALTMYMNSDEGKALQRLFNASNNKKMNED